MANGGLLLLCTGPTVILFVHFLLLLMPIDEARNS